MENLHPEYTLSRVMPLLNTPFQPGHALEAVQAIEDPETREIAMAEYHYFRGDSETASQISEKYLNHTDPALRLSAVWIYSYANLALDRTDQTADMLGILQEGIQNGSYASSPALYDLAVYVSTAATTMLHVPKPQSLPDLKPILRRLPLGLRMFAAYVSAFQTYLVGHCHESYSIADTVLNIVDTVYPIPMLYLHLIATVSLMRTNQIELAKEHMEKAWALAQPDDLIEAFGEHHNLLGGTLEVVIRRDWPDDFRRMIAITYSFSSGWRKLHAHFTGNVITDDLTTMEFTVAMLAARGWGNKEISAHLGISTNTVKQHISTILQKLDITQRKDLSRFMPK